MDKKRIIAVVIATAAVVSMTACSKKNTATPGTEIGKGEVSYPINTTESLTYWMTLPSPLATSVSNFSETDFAAYIKEATGIEVKYIHPAQGTENEAINILLASDNLPDMIASTWVTKSPGSCIEQGLITDLTEYVDDYAPNFKKFINEDEEIRKNVLTDEGVYYAFPFIRNDPLLMSTSGFIVRADWLNEFALEAPETIEEWDKVLECFKTKCESPISLPFWRFDHFASGFNAVKGMYHDTSGRVRFGTIEENYKNYIAKMHEWYEKGYIDKNYAIANQKTIDSNMLTGVSGVTAGSGGSGLGVYLSVQGGQNGYDLTAVKYPVAQKGAEPTFNHRSPKVTNDSTAVSADCKNPALAVRYLDFGYSDAGKMLYNFGKEGASYTMDNGYPKYSEYLFDTSDGHSASEKLAKHCLSIAVGPFVQDKRYIEQYYSLPQQINALSIWRDDVDYEKYNMPTVLLTKEESNEYTKIYNEVDTYLNEMANNMIVGKESVDNFDKYVSRVKEMGIEKAIKIQQNAYDRYLKR